ncbi:sialidase-4-like [Bombina bombina]|uniref:sialidase-4-like n=1 Tax=Bombina bombina TaxID=8345 RepID=UPI00235B0050|nr:sialidase-4-like [Bombina bombina]
MGSRHVPARTVLFEREKNGVTYRVPALLYIPRWSIMLAFAEERLSADDAHANLLVLRRGTFYRNYVEWEDMHAVEKACLPDHRSMNPCPVYDDFTGQLFLFFICVLGRTTESYQIVTGNNLARLCYVTSTDQGRNWSDLTDLTDEVIGESLKDWATFALGPGHGIQLKTGRLLVPAYTYHISCRNCFGKLCQTTPRAFAFRSDNHGQSWMFGELIPNLQTVECQLVSVDEEDGSNLLYCNARSSLGYRVQALSYDDGAVFQPGQLVEKLMETANGCHGSVIGFPAPLGFLSRFMFSHSEKILKLENIQMWTEILSRTKLDFQVPTWVLYSHPTNARSRVNLGVFLSPYPKDADSWTGPWVIYEGPSAYSDLAYLELPPGEADLPESPPVIAFACLYENGLISPYEQISFSIFTLYEVIQSLPPNPSNFKKIKNESRMRERCTTF